MRRTTIMCAVALCISACGFAVDDGEALRAAEALGMRDVHVNDRHEVLHVIAGCSGDDDVAFDVTATNAAGRHVDVVVCCGWPFNGCTVRSR